METHGRPIVPEAEFAEENAETVRLAGRVHEYIIRINDEAYARSLTGELLQVNTVGFLVARAESMKRFFLDHFLPEECGGDEELFHRVLFCSAKTRISEAVSGLLDFLQTGDFVDACEAVDSDSTPEDVQKALLMINAGDSRAHGFTYDLSGFSTSFETDGFAPVPYSLIPESDRLSAISVHLRDFGHDFERCGIGGLLLFSQFIKLTCGRIDKGGYQPRFWRDNLNNLRKATICLLQLLANAISGENLTGKVDFREVAGVVKSALVKRLFIDGALRSAKGIKFDVETDADLNIEDGNFYELVVLLYNLGKNAGVLMERDLNKESSVNYKVRRIEHDGGNYIAVEVSDTCGGIDLRKMFRAKRAQLSAAAEGGDADAGEQLQGFDRWRYRECTIAEIYNYIFERRVSGAQASESRGTRSSGLGLDMARRILQKAGGRVFATDSTSESEEGGAVFLLLFPADSKTRRFEDPLADATAEVPRAIEMAMRNVAA